MIVVCCGMPRSGSTLQFNIVGKVAEAAGIGSREAWRVDSAWERAGDELAAMAREERLHVIKVHVLSKALMEIATGAPDRVRFVYVHRDIRDVVASLQIKFDYSIAKALRRIHSSIELEGWLSARPSGNVLVQDYALLLTALPDAVRDVSMFLGADLRDAEIARIAAALDIDKAYARSRMRKVRFEGLRRRLNFLLGRTPVFADDALMLHPRHVSEHRGQIGIWREHLSAEDVGAVETAFNERIRRGFHV